MHADGSGLPHGESDDKEDARQAQHQRSFFVQPGADPCIMTRMWVRRHG